MSNLAQAGQDAEYLSPEREAELVAKMRAGCKRSRDQLIMSHIKMCTALARKYSAYGHDFDDLHSSCVVGLVKACDRFNPERTNGGRFATYAQYWCRSELNEHMMAHKSLVKIGTTAAQKKCYFGLNAAKARLGIDGVNLTEQQVAALAEDLSVPATVVVEMNMRLRPDASLNAPTLSGNHDAEYEMLDFLQDTSLVAADDAIIAAEQQTADTDALADALTTLSPNERYAMERRVLTDEPATLDVLAKEKGRSRERIRQWQARGQEKIEAHLTGTKRPSAQTKSTIGAKRRARLDYVRQNIGTKTKRQIAAELGLSIKTVENYLKTLRHEARKALPLAA